MGYQIDTHEPSEQFLKARQIAGFSLQKRFECESGKVDASNDYKCIKSELSWPSFDHLTFSYRNQVFSVLVGIEGESGLSLNKKEIDCCLDACSANNLIPCLFLIDGLTMLPSSEGWNLVHLATRQSVIPAECTDEASIEMSEWELRNFCIQLVRNHIKDMCGEVLSFCDVLNIDPQIWFYDKDGNRSWVIVRHYPKITGAEKSAWIGFEKSNPQLSPFDGYFAGVSIASSAPSLKGKDGVLIPLSERFTGNAPLYRGDGFYIKFEGLQRIFVS